MAIALEQRTPATNLEPINGQDSDVLSLTSVTAGSLLVVTGSVYDDPGATTGIAVSSSVDGAFTIATQHGADTVYDDSYSFIAYLENASSGSHNITITFVDTGSFANIAALEFSGIETSSALDQVGEADGSSSNPSVTTASATASGNQLAIAAASCAGNGITWTTPTDYADIGVDGTWDRCACAHVYDLTFSGGSTKSVTWTSDSPNGWIAVIATFKEAAGVTNDTADPTGVIATAAAGTATADGTTAGPSHPFTSVTVSG